MSRLAEEISYPNKRTAGRVTLDPMRLSRGATKSALGSRLPGRGDGGVAHGVAPYSKDICTVSAGMTFTVTEVPVGVPNSSVAIQETVCA